MESSLRPHYYLCINIGSSSLKFAHYCVDTDGHERRLAQASASNIAQADARIEANGASKHRPLNDNHAALLTLLDTLDIRQWTRSVTVSYTGVSTLTPCSSHPLCVRNCKD